MAWDFRDWKMTYWLIGQSTPLGTWHCKIIPYEFVVNVVNPPRLMVLPVSMIILGMLRGCTVPAFMDNPISCEFPLDLLADYAFSCSSAIKLIAHILPVLHQVSSTAILQHSSTSVSPHGLHGYPTVSMQTDTTWSCPWWTTRTWRKFSPVPQTPQTCRYWSTWIGWSP